MFTRPSSSWSSILAPLTLAIAFVVALCSFLYLREADQIGSATLERESRRMEILSNFFDRDLDSTLTDLRLLASGDGLQSYVLTNSPADLERAEHRAEFFITDNLDYDQVRYLDESGQEIYRLNHGGVRVPPQQLQNKGDRPYFQNAIKLNAGEIYISALDLNVEGGVVEQPPKPMLRFAMPVFDTNGRRHGIVIINYLAENAIRRLKEFVASRYERRLRLLNAQGYWIAAARPEKEWGFMVSSRSGETLAKTDPALWAQIVSQPQGQVPYRGGYFTWNREVPAAVAKGKPFKLRTGDDFLVFASEIDGEDWAAVFVSLRQTFVVVALILVFLAAVSSWFFQARRRVQMERDRFFDLTRDMLCVAGFDGYFKRVNPAWAKALGYSSSEMLSKPFLDFVHPDDVTKTLLEMSQLSKGTETNLFENRYRCKDGSYRWLLWSAHPLVEQQLIYGSARDLTERKQIEETLRQNEERSRSIIESAHDAFVSINSAGVISDWNLQAESMFGWPRAEAIGRMLHETIIPERYRAAHIRGMKHFSATGEGPVLNKTLELTALRRTGEEFPVEFVIWPLLTPQGSTFHAFVRDITKRREAETNIQKLNEEMRHRAGLLEVANKELESFSYSVSHDLRAPLRHIHGFVELLQKSPEVQADASNRRYVEVIARAAREMGQLIDDLLAFSRTSRTDMHPIDVDMKAIVEYLISDRELECRGRQIVWDVKPLPKVACDPNLIRLVWTNLLDNALKYSRPREVARIEVGHLAADDRNFEPRKITYYVRDNGVGFDMQYASKLFGVFQRLHSAEQFEGTGIGLANVQRIVHRHGGRVWAQSEMDVGSTFFFSLPGPKQAE